MPGTGQQILPLPSIDWALGCLDVCREVRKTLMSPGFARVDQFIKFFQSVPAQPGCGASAERSEGATNRGREVQDHSN